MKHRSILVTGGCGFIGSNFILDCLELSPSLSIVNLDALTYAGNLKNLASLEGSERYHFQEGCIGNSDLVSRLLEEHRIEAVVNFAAESHVDRSIDQPATFIESNVLQTNHLLGSCQTYFAQLSGEDKERFRFLHVSTDEVFGSLHQEDPAFHEGTPYAPNSPYAASKAASDHLVRAYHHTYGLPVVTTHCSNNYGPFQFPEKLIPFMIKNALEGKALPIYGDGSHIRDWLYVKDQTLCSILDELTPKGDGSYHDQITFIKDRLGHDFRYAINASKIKNELGWKPLMSFDDGIKETIKWYLDHLT